MSFSPLDYPLKNSLLSHHRHLAVNGRLSMRYAPDVVFGAAVMEQSQEAYADLRTLYEAGDVTAVVGHVGDEMLAGWQRLQVVSIAQMVCEKLLPAAPVQAVPLTATDVPEMIALVALTEPGPFEVRTIELGEYIGVRDQGKLVAMAGERMHPPGFCEISAVCTHPDYRGRGYAGGLVTRVAQHILDRQETPFLHHAVSNHGAQRLYEQLGFRRRTTMLLTVMRKTAA